VQLIIYEPIKADQEAFVAFWAARYTGYDDEFYDANVGQDLTETSILEWFTWKNGTPLSEAKRQSVLRNFVARRGELDLASKETASELLARFSEGGAIWRIFWLHCWQPARFPIYDQHVHRAMRFIQAGVQEEIPHSQIIRRTFQDARWFSFSRGSMAEYSLDNRRTFRNVHEAFDLIGFGDENLR
jgi:hypothetical protein